MPEISRFFGIIIYMYAKDHLPPHFHASYNEDEAMFSIETGNIIQGDLPRKQIRLVQAWVELHREELTENYNLLQQETGSFKKNQAIDVMLPRIKSILSVKPYKVTCLWNTGEVREIDFQHYLNESKPLGPIARLADKRLFSEVKTDGRTLYWDNLLTMIDYDGSQQPAPLDFDPDMMYQQSRLLS